MMNTPFWERLNVLSRIFMGSLRRLVVHLLRYRAALLEGAKAQSSFNDLVEACELAFYWGYLLSPFYFFQTSLTRHISWLSLGQNTADVRNSALSTKANF
jgi:hypothetical protein